MNDVSKVFKPRESEEHKEQMPRGREDSMSTKEVFDDLVSFSRSIRGARLLPQVPRVFQRLTYLTPCHHHLENTPSYLSP